jgi:hypothetical protein
MKYFFLVRVQLFVTASLTRIRIHIGLAPWIRIWIHIGVKSWIRIEVKSWIRNCTETNADRNTGSNEVFLQDPRQQRFEGASPLHGRDFLVFPWNSSTSSPKSSLEGGRGGTEHSGVSSSGELDSFRRRGVVSSRELNSPRRRGVPSEELSSFPRR